MKRVSPTINTASRVKALMEPRKLVLYVEDDEANRQVASLRLEKKYELVFAATDREACQALIDHGSRLTIILMDIELQGSQLTGIDLTKLVRGRLGAAERPPFAAGVPELDVPIFFVTAYGQMYRRTELLGAGADEIIQKPVDFVELHTAMTRVYLRRLG